MLITQSMIEKELIALAYQLNIVNRIHVYDLNAKWTNNFTLWIKINNRRIKFAFTKHNLRMSLDDLAEYILLPKLYHLCPEVLINKYYHD